MRTFASLLLLLLAVPAGAITLGEATTEAHQWVVARQDAILSRIETCITEGSPRLCHTAWAASTTANTVAADSALATTTLDDPGRQLVTGCGTCFDPSQGTFAAAGIAIPATAPLNAKINIARGPGGWGVQLVVRIKYEGTEYERGYGRGIFESFAWREVVVAP